MRMTLITLLIAIFSICKAPEAGVLYIERSSGINYYDPLINAVTFVESLHGKYVYNAKEQAVGWMQIRECRILDFNKQTGKNYTHAEMYDYEKSKEVFLYYCKGRSFETVARCWNAGEYGKKEWTDDYWQKVQKALLSQN